MRNSLALAAAAALGAGLAGCRGTIPELHGTPEAGISSVVIGGRIVLPTGETSSGRLHLNLEMEGGGREAEVYRLPVVPQRSLLYQVEPGVYRLAPTRNLLGFHQARLKVRIEGHTYRVPFPKEILRKPVVDIKPAKIVSLGVLEARVTSTGPGKPPLVRVRLDDSVEARRLIVQDLIRNMMDPRASRDLRESAISWTRALDQTLNELLSERQRIPLYKPIEP